MSASITNSDNLVTIRLLRRWVNDGMRLFMTDRSLRSPRTALRRQSNVSAFSLVEMLAVIAIISIMLVLVAPAVGNFGSTAGRKGAVNILMNTMEQARVAALESGRDVHMVFLRRQFPERDAIMVVREREPDDTETGYEQLTRWMQMPKGVLLYAGKEDTKVGLLSLDDTGQFDKSKFIGTFPTGDVNILTFNGFGGVAFPADKNKLMLIVSEGVRGDGGTEAIIGNRKDQFGGFEIITLRRFTGRASLEVSAI